MFHPKNKAYWRNLESNAHLPDVQELIREEILKGTIRVRPKPGGGILILPIGVPESQEPIEVEPPHAPSQEEASPPLRVGRRGRLIRR
jgi:hypothetical protein